MAEAVQELQTGRVVRPRRPCIRLRDAAMVARCVLNGSARREGVSLRLIIAVACNPDRVRRGDLLKLEGSAAWLPRGAVADLPRCRTNRFLKGTLPAAAQAEAPPAALADSGGRQW